MNKEKARRVVEEAIEYRSGATKSQLENSLVNYGFSRPQAEKFVSKHITDNGSGLTVIGVTADTTAQSVSQGSQEASPETPNDYTSKSMDVESVDMDAGRPTTEKYHHLPMLDDPDHPLIPDIGSYYQRPIQGVKDVEVVSMAMNHGDYGTLLVGEPGTGKGHCVKALCRETNRPVVRVNFGSRITKEKLVGYYAPDENGDFSWQDGLLTKAVRHGWVFLADEINNAPPEAAVALNAVLEDADARSLELTEKGEVIEPHPEFQMVGTMNPPSHMGVQPLNKAFKDRFMVIKMGHLPSEAEKTLLANRSGIEESEASQIVDSLSDLRDSYPDVIGTPITTRTMLKVADVYSEMEFDVKSAMELVVTSMVDSEDESVVLKQLDLED